MRVSASFVCVFVLATAGLARAEPLNPKQISADAKWLAHLDADAMRTSVMIDQGYQAQGENARALIDKVAELHDLCQGMDPVKDVKAVTCYGSELTPGGVAILRASMSESAIQRLWEALRKQPDYATSRHGSHELHKWTHGKGTPYEHAVAGAHVAPDLLVAGTSAGEVEKALDVLDGTKPNIAGKSALVAAPPAGALVMVRTAALPYLDRLPVSTAILKQTDVFGLVLGEDKNEAYLTGEFFAKDAQTVGKLKEALDKALTAALQAVEQADLASLINAIQVNSKDKLVTLDLRGPAEASWKYLEKTAQRVYQGVKRRMDAQAAREKK